MLEVYENPKEQTFAQGTSNGTFEVQPAKIQYNSMHTMDNMEG